MEQFVVDRLRASLHERVTTPDHPDYDGARATFNATVQRRPAVIVRVRDDDDVVAAVVAAGDLGLPIAVRGGGHSVAGHAMADGALVVDLRDRRDGHGRPGDEDRARRRRGALGGRRHRGVEASPRGGRRDGRRHRRGRPDARRRDRLAVRASRVHLRQPRPAPRSSPRPARRSWPVRTAIPTSCGRCAAAAATSASSRPSNSEAIDPGPILAGYIHYPDQRGQAGPPPAGGSSPRGARTRSS